MNTSLYIIFIAFTFNLIIFAFVLWFKRRSLNRLVLLFLFTLFCLTLWLIDLFVCSLAVFQIGSIALPWAFYGFILAFTQFKNKLLIVTWYILGILAILLALSGLTAIHWVYTSTAVLLGLGAILNYIFDTRFNRDQKKQGVCVLFSGTILVGMGILSTFLSEQSPHYWQAVLNSGTILFSIVTLLSITQFGIIGYFKPVANFTLLIGAIILIGVFGIRQISQSLQMLFPNMAQLIEIILWSLFIFSFQIIKDAIQQITDRLFLLADYDADATLNFINSKIVNVVDQEQLERFYSDIILTETLKVTHFNIWIKNDQNQFCALSPTQKQTVFESADFTQTQLILQRLKHQHRHTIIKPDIQFRLKLIQTLAACFKFTRKRLAPQQKELESILAFLSETQSEIILGYCPDGQVIGILSTGAKQSGADFRSKDLQLLSQIISQILILQSRISQIDRAARIESEHILQLTYQDKIERQNKELSKTLKKLKQTQNKLVDAEKLSFLGQIAGEVAHEIRHPVAFLNSFSKDFHGKDSRLSKTKTILQYLYSEAEQNALQSQVATKFLQGALVHLNHLEDSAEKMEKKRNELLTFCSKFLIYSRASQEIPSQAIEIGDPVQSTVQEFEEECRRKNISITLQLTAKNQVQIFEFQIVRICRNLIKNAIIAMEESPNTPKQLHIALYDEIIQTNHFSLLKVSDTGVGIAKSHIHKIYDPLYSKRKTTEKGTGLGLSIIKKMLDTLDARVTVETVLHKGTTFCIHFKSYPKP